ncbi:hypothetical protein PM082_015400 [Marasmius tenuissimus]|nr:hypothetical protein PM082_015400 [Marasmius tenuissimus]
MASIFLGFWSDGGACLSIEKLGVAAVLYGDIVRLKDPVLQAHQVDCGTSRFQGQQTGLGTWESMHTAFKLYFGIKFAMPESSSYNAPVLTSASSTSLISRSFSSYDDQRKLTRLVACLACLSLLRRPTMFTDMCYEYEPTVINIHHD